MDDLKQQLYLIADEMRGMASIGKHFAGNVYEVERAHRIMELAVKVAALADESPVETVKAIFEQEPWLRVSPAVGVDAFVLNNKGEILLIQRKDNAHWATPGGLCEIGHTFAETAVLELWEEAGLRGRAERLLGVFDARLWGSTAKVHLMNITFLVHCDDLTPAPGIECLDAQFFARDHLPTPMHPGHDKRIPKCFELLDSGQTHFDPSDATALELPMHQRHDNNGG
jgi:ADP-ribose pyrophosphatase YjhB (NUDIX family)